MDSKNRAPTPSFRRRRSENICDTNISDNDPSKEFFEACRNGDLTKVSEIANSVNVNARDTTGRRSTPLHFAAGFIE